MSAPGIEINNACLEYQQHLLFDHLNLIFQPQQWTCILAPSGTGKTSLLRLIAGLETCARSSEPIRATDGKPLKNRIAYLAQQVPLLPWLNTLDNILIGMKLRREKIQQQHRDLAAALLTKVGLEKFVNFMPRELSGGMKQRVLLARTLFENKPIILMDEPFAALDVITRNWIGELAAELLRDKTVILVTHDPLEALRLGHHIYVLAGRPAYIVSEFNVPNNPPRNLTQDLLFLQGEILTSLSHSKEIIEC